MNPEPRRLDGAHEPAYLTVEEVAAMLRVSRASIYRLAASDDTMPVLRLPGAMRFPRERLERWLRAREQGLSRPRRINHQEPVAVSTSTSGAP